MLAAISFIYDHGCIAGAQENPFISLKGKITKVTGDVRIRRSQEKDWTPATYGMELGVEDQIITGSKSSADIVFVRNGVSSKVRILEKADMCLMTLSLDKVTGDSEILLDLAIGHIIVQTDSLKGNSKFEVLTPTSMTAVRGTGFEINVTREEKDPVRM